MMKKLLALLLSLTVSYTITAFAGTAPRLVTFAEYDADTAWQGVEFEASQAGWEISSIILTAYEPYSTLCRFAIAADSDGDWMTAPKYYTLNGSLHPDADGIVEAPLLYKDDEALHPMEIDPGTYRIEITEGDSDAEGEPARTIIFTTLTPTALSSPVTEQSPVYYNLQGHVCDNPTGGVYIRIDHSGAHTMLMR